MTVLCFWLQILHFVQDDSVTFQDDAGTLKDECSIMFTEPTLKCRWLEAKTGVFRQTEHQIHVLDRLSCCTLYKIVNA